MSALLGVVALVMLVGAVALGWFVSKGGRPRTGLLCLLLGVVTVATLFLLQVAQILYRPSAVVMAALGAGLIAMVVLFISIGKDVDWKAVRVAALVGVVLVVMGTFLFGAIAMPTGDLFVPLLEARARQMAEDQGFDVLLAPEETMFTEYLPVTEVGSGEGVQIQYERFTLTERVADVDPGEGGLREVLAPGAEPLGPGSVRVEPDADYDAVSVNGELGLIATYKDRSTAEKSSFGIEDIRVLAFVRDGVLVTVYSQGRMEYQPKDDIYTPVDALVADELVRVAETLEPVQ